MKLKHELYILSGIAVFVYILVFNQYQKDKLLDDYMIGNKQAEDVYNYCNKNNDPKKYYNCLEYFGLEF